jgi:predicted 3-demethylubiquinone-9 3-methyltransferase (glyoxalase superfamily)
MSKTIQKITPFLWFESHAEEAANFYTSIFRNSKILNVTRYGEGAPKPKGSVMTIAFELDGQKFMGINGGPYVTFNDAISFVVNCETQDEIDYFWKRLTDGGQEVRCGWLKDKYGVSWQVVPTALGELLTSRDAAKSQRVMNALMQMMKLDIETLRNA